VDLKVPIAITDELTEGLIEATALLNLASGEIERVEYQGYDAELLGLPFERDDYEFSSGTLTNNGRDVEFEVLVNRGRGATAYSVSPTELLEVKKRAAALFTGATLETTPAAPPTAAARGRRRS
jgi:hypothetical protein